MTYDENHIPANRELSYYDVRCWLKRIRKFLSPYYRLKYFCAGEYGDENHRPHYHFIMFGLPEEKPLREAIVHTTWGKCWAKGITDKIVRDTGAYNYVTKYILKQGALVLISKGLGWEYAENHVEEYLRRGYIMYRGVKYSIPRYYERHVELFKLAESKKGRRGRYEQALRLKAEQLLQSEYEFWNARQKEVDQMELNLKAKHGG